MSGIPQRLPASVYRRRRLAVFGGLLAVIVVIVLIIVRPGFGESGTPATDNQATEDVVVTPPCLPTDIELLAQTDSQSYSSGQIPQLWLTVKNVGMSACELSVGTDIQEYIITSGEDRIWSSRDCQKGGVPLTIVLQPGEEQSTTPIPWDRTRSSATTCDTARPPMPAGGASYKLEVVLGDFTSPEKRQFLLN